MFFFDPIYMLVLLPALALMIYAQIRVKRTYSRYAQVANMHGYTGAQVAQLLLRDSGLTDVNIEAIPGELTDNYDPRGKVLHLSQGVYGGQSVAALGIVAHEVGHAVQDNQGYMPMRLRASLVPMANLGSQIGPWMVILGIWMQFTGMVWLGIIFFAAAVAFSLVTLPVELNASSRAMVMLTRTGLVSTVDADGARQVLSAAALTYVAALLVAMVQLLYFVMRAMGMGGRDND